MSGNGYENSDPGLLLPLIPPNFVSEINSDEYNLKLSFTAAPDDGLLDKFIQVMSSTIGNLYLKHKGKNWKTEKLAEMKEFGLVYAYYVNDKTNEIAAFTSFLHSVYSNGGTSLYLYEIHVLPGYQKSKIGTQLINSFHLIAKKLNCKTELTVFSDNSNALSWYEGLNYEISIDSPQNRVLKSGRVIKPDYYILERSPTASTQ